MTEKHNVANSRMLRINDYTIIIEGAAQHTRIGGKGRVCCQFL